MTTTRTYSVTGMTCDHCVQAVRSEVAEIPGVTDVEVDLARGEITVESAEPLDAETFAAAVDEAGYEVAP